MKLRYIIPSFIAVVAAMMASCTEDDEKTYLSGLRVSQSYVSISTDGGSTTITLKANADWAFENQQWIEKKDTTNAPAPKWLTIDPVSGSAGETTITFSAESTNDGRTAVLKLASGGQVQIINVIQGLSTISDATCKEVMEGPESKTYRVKGTVTKIANEEYGNWFLDDGTYPEFANTTGNKDGLYIYGTLDKNGKDGKNNSIAAWGIEVGDIVTIEGPKTDYKGTIELVNVTVVKIEKSLIKVDSLSSDEPLPLEGGDIIAYITNKGNGIGVEIPEDAQSWLGISGISGNTVTFHATENLGGDRSTTVTFNTTDGKKTYSSQVTIEQKGAILEVSVADFLAAEVGDVQYRVTGIITSVAKAAYGNVYIRDFSGEAYVYGIGAKGDFEALGLKAGDIVTLVGKRGEYNGAAQMTGAICEKSISVTKVTLDEFLTKADADDVYYMVTGTVDEVVNAAYGNLYLKDGDTRLYVYGTYPGWGATGDNRKNLLETKEIVVGDKLTVIGVKTTYNDAPQVKGGLYFSHEKAE